jgi:hypothetical protein
MSLIFVSVTSNAFAAVSRILDGFNVWGVHLIVRGVPKRHFPD